MRPSLCFQHFLTGYPTGNVAKTEGGVGYTQLFFNIAAQTVRETADPAGTKGLLSA
jgi:hypothetical protein